MSARELVVLGSASQSPTRERNHNGYLLRWDGESVLFDPGEGTQRQFTLAGVSPATIDRICITHFHGDHCLGLPGVILRLELDQGRLPVPIHYPAGGEEYFRRLRYASAGQEEVGVDPRPVSGAAVVHSDSRYSLHCAPLDHPVETLGWRVQEPDGRHMLVDRLDEAGIEGPDVGRLIEQGHLTRDGRTVTLEEMSEHRAGQAVAVVMDTAWCDGALELARNADLLLCEATFLATEEHLCATSGHLSARQAGRLAAEAGARRLVLTHFSRRYPDPGPFLDEARQEFGDVILADDLLRIPVPTRG